MVSTLYRMRNLPFPEGFEVRETSAVHVPVGQVADIGFADGPLEDVEMVDVVPFQNSRAGE